MLIHATHTIGKSKVVVVETSTQSNGCSFMNPGAVRVVKLPADEDYVHARQKGAEVIFNAAVAGSTRPLPPPCDRVPSQRPRGRRRDRPLPHRLSCAIGIGPVCSCVRRGGSQ